MSTHWFITENFKDGTALENLLRREQSVKDWIDRFHKLTNLKYLLIAKELGKENKVIHYHAVLQFGRSIKKEQLIKWNGRANYQFMNGSLEECKYYFQSDEKANIHKIDIIEFGEYTGDKQQGKRNDLETVLNTCSSAKEVKELYPSTYLKFYKHFKEFYKINIPKRTEAPICYWIYGPAGTGKTRFIYDKFNVNEIYNWSFHNDFIINYKGEKCCLIDDFRGEIKYNLLLKILDRYPLTLNEKGNPDGIEFNSKYIFITSPLKPNEIYYNLASNDSLAQLYRRIEILHINDIHNINI